MHQSSMLYTLSLHITCQVYPKNSLGFQSLPFICSASQCSPFVQLLKILSSGIFIIITTCVSETKSVSPVRLVFAKPSSPCCI